MKQIISWFLTIALLLLLAMPVAIAEDERTSGEFTYRIKGNGTAVITGYDWDRNQGEDIYIPRMIDGYTVTEIGSKAFAELEYDDNYVIEFKQSNEAGRLVLSDTVTSIGDMAFMGIEFNASSISIPSNVQYIGKGAFSNSTGIKEFIVDSANPNYASIDGILYNKQQKSLVAYPLDYENNKLSILSIPEGICSIEDYAFFGAGYDEYRRKNISIYFPSTVTSIGNYSFARLGKKWTYINGIESMKEMGTGAYYMAKLESLEFGDVTEIPPYAFFGVKYGNSYAKNLPSGLKSIGDYAFARSDIYVDTVGSGGMFPASLESIGHYAFFKWVPSNANRLVRLDFTNSSIKTIGDFAFASAFVHPEIILPEGIEEIGTNAFVLSKPVDTVKLPSSLISLGESVFDMNTKLEVVSGTYGAMWAFDNGYVTVKEGGDDTSWLN